MSVIAAALVGTTLLLNPPILISFQSFQIRVEREAQAIRALQVRLKFVSPAELPRKKAEDLEKIQRRIADVYEESDRAGRAALVLELLRATDPGVSRSYEKVVFDISEREVFAEMVTYPGLRIVFRLVDSTSGRYVAFVSTGVRNVGAGEPLGPDEIRKMLEEGHSLKEIEAAAGERMDEALSNREIRVESDGDRTYFSGDSLDAAGENLVGRLLSFDAPIAERMSLCLRAIYELGPERRAAGGRSLRMPLMIVPFRTTLSNLVERGGSVVRGVEVLDEQLPSFEYPDVRAAGHELGKVVKDAPDLSADFEKTVEKLL